MVQRDLKKGMILAGKTLVKLQYKRGNLEIWKVKCNHCGSEKICTDFFLTNPTHQNVKHCRDCKPNEYTFTPKR